jgi:hypothetical protein
MTADRVIAALSRLRLNTVAREEHLCAILEGVFFEESFRFCSQVRLAVAARIDFLIEGGIGVEVKAGPVPYGSTVRQLRRYAGSDRVSSLLLVTERGLPGLPESLLGKPVRQVALQQLWGIAS